MSSRKPTAIQRLRHSLIAEWRGVADGPILDHAVLSVADMVPKIMAQYGLGERLQMEEKKKRYQMRRLTPAATVLYRGITKNSSKKLGISTVL
jgi:hypothetical protein